MQTTLFSLALLTYIAAVVVRLGDIERFPGLARLGTPALVLGFVLHLGGLVAYTVQLGELPLRGPSGSMATISALVAAGFLWTRRNPRADAVGSFVIPLAVVLLALALFLPGETGGAVAPGGALWFPVHAAMMLVGLGGFGLAFGVSLLYLLVRWRLKNKKLVGLRRLPSLDTLDRLNTRFMVLGFTALTIGIAAGGLWAAALPERPAMGPTVYGSLVLWIWYAAAIQVRVVGGWRGRLAAGFSVVGFVGLAASLLAMLVVIQGWHT
jgi:ABC-type uncharacterized transport system permease subunit